MSFLRSLLGIDAGAREKGIEAERELTHGEEQKRGELRARQIAAFGAAGAEAIELGSLVGSKERLSISSRQAFGHLGLFGPSGAGKSFLLCGLLMSLLRSGLRRLSLWDPKAETALLLKRGIIDVAQSLPSDVADDLLGRVVCFDPFSASVLPRLQLLAPEPGLDPELHAHLIAQLLTSDSDQAVGVRQEAILHRAVQCMILAGLPLTVLPTALSEPLLFDALAERHASSELFRATAARLRSESAERIAGILARLDRLLRLRSTRLAVGGAPDCVDFDRLLSERIVIANLEPPQGSVDVGRFMAGAIWVRLQQAIRRRPNGAPPSLLILEEAPAFLASGNSQAASSLEDLLRLARSKGVFMYLLSQDLGTSLGKISSILPTVIRENTHLQIFFRATSDDWSFALPVTGRRMKPAGAPWEERRGYLDRGAELALLRDELTKLPDRTCYLLDRRSGLPAILMRTADVRLRATDAEVKALEARAAQSDAVLQVAELEKGERDVEERVRALLGAKSAHATEAAAPSTPLRRRGRQVMNLG